MIQANFRTGFFLGLLALVLLAPNGVQAITFNSIVVFGGSVSDSGNAFALTGIANKPPYDKLDAFLVPTGPYSTGGHHFSNGATWVEDLAKYLGLNRNANPAFQGSSPFANNYAVGGARSTDGPDTFDLPEQVGAFLKDHGKIAPSDALYVIDFGGNDVRDALAAVLVNGDPNVILMKALDSIFFNLETLYTAGARKFLLLKVANIGRLPSVLILDVLYPGAAALAMGLTVGFNTGLDSVINSFIMSKPPAAGVDVAVLDVYVTVETLIDAPQDYGLTEVQNACVTPNVPPFSCKNPDQFLFWDGIHPTKTVQAIFAEEAAAVLGK